MDPLNSKVIILTIRNPEVDPEVNLGADHLVDPAVLLPEGTESILVMGLALMTRVKIEATEQIVAHTTVMITTGTIPVMADIMMIDILTSTEVGIMTGATTGDMMTEVDTGLHAGVLLILGLMTTVQMT